MLTAICDLMAKAYDLNWITTRDGNCSLRKGGSKTMYGFIKCNCMCICLIKATWCHKKETKIQYKEHAPNALNWKLIFARKKEKVKIEVFCSKRDTESADYNKIKCTYRKLFIKHERFWKKSLTI